MTKPSKPPPDLTAALVALAPKMPATAKDLGAPRGHARALKALEEKGWIRYADTGLWSVTRAGEAEYARATS